MKSKQKEVKEIGKQFGVFSIFDIDIALPRIDSRSGSGLGRKPTVASQPNLDFAKASRRRDLTINAMGFDPLTGELLDDQGGLKDLKRKILRAVDPELFVDDPLRVLRVMQFAGRFGFRVESKTRNLCRRTDLSHLAKERVGEEWQKLLFKSPKPSKGLDVGFDMKVIQRLHPEFVSVFKRNLRTVDRAAKIIASDRISAPIKRLLMLASLIQSAEQERIKRFFGQINVSNGDTQSVIKLLDAFRLLKSSSNLSDASVRRLSFDVFAIPDVSFSDLAIFALVLGGLDRVKKAHARAKRLKVFNRPPKSVLSGKDLIRLGVKPGKAMGLLLDEVFEQQLEGVFDEGKHVPSKRKAIEFVRKTLDVDKS